MAMEISLKESLSVALLSGLVLGMPGLLLVWFYYGTCNWGRHRFGPWGKSYDAMHSTGYYGMRRQDRTCEICGAESYRHY
jgi:hypothetical protein